jgi:hypothetical protein
MQHASTGSIMAVAVLLAALTGCSKQTAEEKGAALATEKIDLVKGVGSALEEKGAQAAESLTSGLGKVDQQALQQLHADVMRPGDGLMFLDRLDLSAHHTLIEALSKQEPIYRKQPDLGWWGRMKQRWHSPRLVIIDVELTDEAVS